MDPPPSDLAQNNTTLTREQQHPFGFHLIPNEILCYILVVGYLHAGDESEAFRTTVSQVSHRWREIINNTPSFWTILLIYGTLDKMLQSLSVALERSKSFPLDIRIQLTSWWTEDEIAKLMKKIIPHSKRWRHLAIQTTRDSVLSHFSDLAVPILEDVQITTGYNPGMFQLELPPLFHTESMLKLTSLVLCDADISATALPLHRLTVLELHGNANLPRLRELYDVLSGSRTLERLVINLYFILSSPSLEDESLPPICLPSLRSFNMMIPKRLSTRVSLFINRFSFPKIISMTVEDIFSPIPLPPLIHYSRLSPTLNDQKQPLLNEVGGPSLYIYHLGIFPFAHHQHLITLELCNVHWPEHTPLSRIFAAMPALENLRISDNSTAYNTVPSTYGVVELPSLRRFEFTMVNNVSVYSEALNGTYLTLLSAFRTPRLESLMLENLHAKECGALFGSFVNHGSVNLRSLTLINTRDIVSLDVDLGQILPQLTHLALYNTSSSTFLHHLIRVAGEPDSRLYPISCPMLRTLAISNASGETSRPLLHRLITSRKSAGHPITRLVLGHHFKLNRDSWDWLHRNVEEIVNSDESNIWEAQIKAYQVRAIQCSGT